MKGSFAFFRDGCVFEFGGEAEMTEEKVQDLLKQFGGTRGPQARGGGAGRQAAATSVEAAVVGGRDAGSCRVVRITAQEDLLHAAQ